MTKDAIDSLAAVVPEEVTGAPRGPRLGAPGRPRDRRMGKRGAAVLERVPLFMGLSRRHVTQLAEMAGEVSFRRGEHIVEAGMLGGTLFVILQGEAKVVRGRRAVARMVPGDFFGEISVLDGGPRTATVIAETPLVAVRISRHTLRKLLLAEPIVAVKILDVVARRLREMERPLTG